MKKESLRRRKKNRKVKYILQMNTNDHLFSDNLLCASLGRGFSCLLKDISFQETKIYSRTLFLQMNTNDLSANSLCASLGCEFSCRPSLEVPSSTTHPHIITVFYFISVFLFPIIITGTQCKVFHIFSFLYAGWCLLLSSGKEGV